MSDDASTPADPLRKHAILKRLGEGLRERADGNTREALPPEMEALLKKLQRL